MSLVGARPRSAAVALALFCDHQDLLTAQLQLFPAASRAGRCHFTLLAPVFPFLKVLYFFYFLIVITGGKTLVLLPPTHRKRFNRPRSEAEFPWSLRCSCMGAASPTPSSCFLLPLALPTWECSLVSMFLSQGIFISQTCAAWC